jgi:hypothetical protein
MSKTIESYRINTPAIRGDQFTCSLRRGRMVSEIKLNIQGQIGIH